MNENCILWFRKDLRLDDNPALMEASKHKKIIPLFIFDRNLEEYNNILLIAYDFKRAELPKHCLCMNVALLMHERSIAYA